MMKLKFPVTPNLENGMLFNNVIWFSILSKKTKISLPNFVGEATSYVFLLLIGTFFHSLKVHLILL